MLRVPTEPFMRAHSFRIPACNKTGIRPTGRADQNFPGTRLRRSFFCHEKQETRLLPKANSVRARIWLRGRDLNSRPSGYEPDELPGCSTPRVQNSFDVDTAQTEKTSLDLKATRKRQSVCVRRPCAFVDTWRKDPLPNGKAAKFLSAPP